MKQGQNKDIFRHVRYKTIFYFQEVTGEYVQQNKRILKKKTHMGYRIRG